MPRLVLGPLLRHVGQDDATVWVKTDRPCTVEVRPAEPVPGCSCEAQRTFELEGHHFALLHVTGLPGDRETSYEVHLDGERAWPPPAEEWDWPASCIRPLTGSGEVRICFGSCRVACPQEPPWTLPKDQEYAAGNLLRPEKYRAPKRTRLQSRWQLQQSDPLSAGIRSPRLAGAMTRLGW